MHAWAAWQLQFSPAACGTLGKHVTKRFPQPAAPDCSTVTHLEGARREYDPAGGEPDDAGAAGVVDVVAAHREVSLEDCVAEGDAPRRQKLVERGHVGPARLGDPPLPRVLVVEFHLLKLKSPFISKDREKF